METWSSLPPEVGTLSTLAGCESTLASLSRAAAATCAIMSPEETPEEIWLLTYWTDRPSYLAWHRSPAHSDSHKYMPKGLRLDPKRTKLTYFEYVSG